MLVQIRVTRRSFVRRCEEDLALLKFELLQKSVRKLVLLKQILALIALDYFLDFLIVAVDSVVQISHQYHAVRLHCRVVTAERGNLIIFGVLLNIDEALLDCPHIFVSLGDFLSALA